MFENIVTLITEPSSLSAVPLDIIEEQQLKFQAVPNEYFVFLREVGWGNIGGMMMYRGLLDPNSISPPREEPWEDVFVFGDNWLGSRFGFDLNDGELLEITPEGDVETVDEKFAEFIARYVG